MVHGNDDSSSAEDLALGYKQLQRVAAVGYCEHSTDEPMTIWGI